MQRPVLGVMPNFTAIPRPNDRVILAGAYMSGMAQYARHWDGGLFTIIEPASAAELEANRDRALGGDNVELPVDELPFGMAIVDYFDEPALEKALLQCDLVLSGIHHRQNHIGEVCARLGIPLIYGSEYSLKTRFQIIMAETKNPLRRARRMAWEWNNERLHVKAIQKARGIQCAGTPTFEDYETLTTNPFLFFESRTTSDQLVSEADLDTRLAELDEFRPLRLAFAGRLNKMKGGDELIKVADHLRTLRVPFEMKIFGGGVLEAQMKKDIERLRLGHRVELMGYRNRDTELFPHLKHQTDLFVCCHPQGDPSATYVDTLACGVPIVGYDNDAFRGILEHSSAGRAVPIGDALGLARVIREVDQSRTSIASWARRAREFAVDNTFDKSFARRIAHMKDVLTKAQESGAGRP